MHRALACLRATSFECAQAAYKREVDRRGPFASTTFCVHAYVVLATCSHHAALLARQIFFAESGLSWQHAVMGLLLSLQKTRLAAKARKLRAAQPAAAAAVPPAHPNFV